MAKLKNVIFMQIDDGEASYDGELQPLKYKRKEI